MTEPDNDFLQKRIDSFVFENDTRIQNVCKDDDIITVGDLVNRSEAELLRMPNAGSKTVGLIKQFLAEHGLALRPDPYDPERERRSEAGRLSYRPEINIKKVRR